MIDIVLKSKASIPINEMTGWIEHLNKQSNNINFIFIPDIFDIVIINNSEKPLDK